MITDTQRIDWLIDNKTDIEAPFGDDATTWIIYTENDCFGKGAGCHTDLRAAIDMAMTKSGEDTAE